MMWFIALSASAETAADLEVVWALSVDGVAIGTRSVHVRYQGETGSTRVRILEGFTELHGGTHRRDQWAYQQRLTANSHEGAPASFHSVLEADGEAREIQARFADGAWSVTVVQATGAKTYALDPRRVDLSTVDLFDPESDRRLALGPQARILSAETGKILEGPVISLGTSVLDVGGEGLPVDGYQWETEVGTWRFWYATNGFLVKYEAPLLGRLVEGVLIGPAPRAIDEFPVVGLAAVESAEL